MEPVALAVVHRDPVAVDLGDAVGAARVERRQLGLGRFADLAEHLRRARLVEADLRVDEPDRVEHPGHAESGRLAGEDRLAERRLDEGLRRQVVELIGLALAQDVDDRDLVKHLARDECDAVLDVRDALERDRARPADHAEHLVALVEEELREVRTVLPGYTGDERATNHGPVLGEGPGPSNHPEARFRDGCGVAEARPANGASPAITGNCAGAARRRRCSAEPGVRARLVASVSAGP